MNETDSKELDSKTGKSSNVVLVIKKLQNGGYAAISKEPQPKNHQTKPVVQSQSTAESDLTPTEACSLNQRSFEEQVKSAHLSEILAEVKKCQVVLKRINLFHEGSHLSPPQKKSKNCLPIQDCDKINCITTNTSSVEEQKTNDEKNKEVATNLSSKSNRTRKSVKRPNNKKQNKRAKVSVPTEMNGTNKSAYNEKRKALFNCFLKSIKRPRSNEISSPKNNNTTLASQVKRNVSINQSIVIRKPAWIKLLNGKDETFEENKTHELKASSDMSNMKQVDINTEAESDMSNMKRKDINTKAESDMSNMKQVDINTEDESDMSNMKRKDINTKAESDMSNMKQKDINTEDESDMSNMKQKDINIKAKCMLQRAPDVIPDCNSGTFPVSPTGSNEDAQNKSKSLGIFANDIFINAIPDLIPNNANEQPSPCHDEKSVQQYDNLKMLNFENVSNGTDNKTIICGNEKPFPCRDEKSSQKFNYLKMFQNPKLNFENLICANGKFQESGKKEPIIKSSLTINKVPIINVEILIRETRKIKKMKSKMEAEKIRQIISSLENIEDTNMTSESNLKANEKNVQKSQKHQQEKTSKISNSVFDSEQNNSPNSEANNNSWLQNNFEPVEKLDCLTNISISNVHSEIGFDRENNETDSQLKSNEVEEIQMKELTESSNIIETQLNTELHGDITIKNNNSIKAVSLIEIPSSKNINEESLKELTESSNRIETELNTELHEDITITNNNRVKAVSFNEIPSSENINEESLKLNPLEVSSKNIQIDTRLTEIDYSELLRLEEEIAKETTYDLESKHSNSFDGQEMTENQNTWINTDENLQPVVECFVFSSSETNTDSFIEPSIKPVLQLPNHERDDLLDNQIKHTEETNEETRSPDLSKEEVVGSNLEKITQNGQFVASETSSKSKVQSNEDSPQGRSVTFSESLFCSLLPPSFIEDDSNSSLFLSLKNDEPYIKFYDVK